MIKATTNFIFYVLGFWLIIATALSVFEINIIFPIGYAANLEVPYHRWQSVRLAAFLTLAYFIGRHVIIGGIPILPIVFFSAFLKSLVFISFILIFNENVERSEWVVWTFFLLFSILVHFVARRDAAKIYFNK